MTFSIAMDSRENYKDSNIQFGGYNPGYIKEGHYLQLINTINANTWAVQAKDFKIGDTTSDGLSSFLTGTRKVFFEPSSPFIYAP